MTDRYTDAEIVELYRRGKRDPYIMDKLCDLTLMPEDKLLSILHLAGEALEISRTQKRTGRSRKISDQVWREIIALRLQGIGYAEITAHTGVHRGSLNNWRKQAERLGVSLPDHKVTSGIQCIPEDRKEDQKMDEKIKQESEKRDPLFDRMYDAIKLFKNSGYNGNFKLEYSEGVLSVVMTIGS